MFDGGLLKLWSWTVIYIQIKDDHEKQRCVHESQAKNTGLNVCGVGANAKVIGRANIRPQLSVDKMHTENECKNTT